tara:strand:+ start:41 stop:223 length:183 start_codon:yes stop_codon:yes gene_type:complete
MRIALLFFIISLIFFVIAYTNTINKKIYSDIKIKLIPRNLYDEFISNSILFPIKELPEDT